MYRHFVSAVIMMIKIVRSLDTNKQQDFMFLTIDALLCEQKEST